MLATSNWDIKRSRLESPGRMFFKTVLYSKTVNPNHHCIYWKGGDNPKIDGVFLSFAEQEGTCGAFVTNREGTPLKTKIDPKKDGFQYPMPSMVLVYLCTFS